jgi:hypothetical protein
LTTIITITIISPAGTNDEDCATTLLNPKTLPINSPATAFNARGAADLAVQADLIWIIAAAVFAILIVGFASNALLSRGKCRAYEKSKSHSEKAEKRIESHELAPVKFEDNSAEPGRASWKRRSMCALSVTQRERIRIKCA